MPISRYEIRNEYSLADPDLYRASDKDDPEALLEGVAMAGLVGVLRQLGDLAEFAADIFHDLHEEVMATSSRGHGLMIRVQQLETEIPNIERAFLSQTDHSSFFDHTGVDWHPNIRIDQNLVTQGDLPRMVMDSYEECRPPPRLFLLDKFDVAGAGACLKRYSDPSFFKLENSGMTNADVVPREKKNRKAKKKGPRWKNGEMTEILPTSHTKLHQLFMEEERIENGVSNPILRANLKRRLNGFPFNKKHGESYMEKFLRPTSPDNKVVHEVTVNPSPLVSATFDYNESGLEVVGVRQVTPHRGNVGRKRSPPSSSEREQIIVNSTIDDKIRGVPSLYPSGSTIVSISSPDKEKIIAMDSHREGSLTGYQYDDIESEVDNYVDATSTVGLDTDAESSLRLKSDFTPSHVKNDSLISDANDKNLQIRSFDSQSTGDSTISDEGNNSFRKGMSSLSSDSPTTSVKNPQFEISSTLRFSCAIVDDFSVANKHSETAFSADTCPNTDAITNQKSDYEQTTSGSRVAGKGILEGTNSDKSECTLDDEDNRSNLVMDLSRSPSVSDAELHSEDGSQKSYAGKHLVDERNGERIYTVTYIHSHMANDSSNKITSDLQHWDESDREDQNSVENRAFDSNLNNVHSLDKNVTPGEISSSRNLILGQVDTFLKKNIEETSPSDAQTIDAEDNHTDRYINNQISSEDLVLSHLEPSPDWPQIDSIAREIGVTLEEGTTVNEACVPVSCTTPQISPDDSEHQESSYSTPGELKESPGGEPVSMDDTKINRQEVTEISRLSDLKLLNDVHTLSKEEKSNTEDMVPAVPALSEVHILLDESDESTGADMPSPMPALSQVGPTKVAEEEIYSFEDSGLDELDNGNNSLPESHGELSLTEKVDQIKATAYGFENNDYPESEVSGSIVHNPLVDLEASDQGLEPVRPGKTQPPVEQSHLNGEHEITHQSTLENYMSDPPSIPVSDNEVEESIIPEETGLLFREISSEDPTVLPINNHQKMPDPLGSILPLSDPLSTTNLTDIPPLPPLPPSQWMMMGTLQLGSSSLLPQLSSQSAGTTDDDHASSRFGPFTPSSNDGKSPLEETTHSPIQTVNEPTSKEKLQLGLVSSKGDLIKHNEVFPQLVSGLIASFDRMKNPLIRIPDEPQSNDENAKSSRVEVNSMCKDVSTLQEEKAKNSHVDVKSENNQQSVMPTEEGGVANGSRVVKLPRPRHPLIDEFTALDKSKLRKVTERFRPPQVQKVVERDSMLEQIRTKSFNLKPALAPRPSIRGPSTNLKVAAIVEKAKAIRQALAGSDEDDDDDDDSWSDS